MTHKIARLIGAAAFLFAGAAQAQSHVTLAPTEGDYIAHDFHFADGEVMKTLRLHYTTLGTIHRDANGKVDNAILIMHGTGGDGHQFFRPQFADVLFKPGGVLDPTKYFIILPDDIGHGKSSKPSDGLRMKFPHYDYADMVRAEHLVVTKALNVNHLRVVMGTSMGCMHSFMWGETYPDMMDAMLPLACRPTQIAGRNRIWRQMLMSAIKQDPAWKGGAYKTQPVQGLRTAADILVIAGSAPLQMLKEYPTRDAADAYVAKRIPEIIASVDANDMLYQFASSGSYDPSAGLEKIKAKTIWINSGDDFINPPELGVGEKMAKRLRNGRYVLIPASLKTHGHGTHTWAAVWQNYLAELLKNP